RPAGTDSNQPGFPGSQAARLHAHRRRRRAVGRHLLGGIPARRRRTHPPLDTAGGTMACRGGIVPVPTGCGLRRRSAVPTAYERTQRILERSAAALAAAAPATAAREGAG